MRDLYWIGTDEAGYGPNLGPLCIAGSRFQISNEQKPVLPFKEPKFLAAADELDWHSDWKKANGHHENLPPIADSKKAYSSGQSLQNLHSVVTSFLSSAKQWPEGKRLHFPKLASSLDVGIVGNRKKSPAPYWLKTKIAKSELEVGLGEWWDGCWFQPDAIGTRLISEQQFNSQVTELGNKATVLSVNTLQIVKHHLRQLPDSCDVIVDCDRHGGRKKYLPLLLDCLDADWIETLEETKEKSVYFWNEKGPNGSDAIGRRMYFRFEVKGERRFPVAVASQFAKYFREQSMDRLNEFWHSVIPNLRPTAGYPQDAKRFLAEIESQIKNTKLSMGEIWRNC